MLSYIWISVSPMAMIGNKRHHRLAWKTSAKDAKESSMDGYLGWLTSGLIFLLILGVHDARAASVDAGSVRCEFLSEGASLPAGQPCSSMGGNRAASGFALRTSHHAALPYAGNEPRH